MSTTTEEVYYRRTEVSEEKKKLVEELAQELTTHQVVGLVRLEQISSKILQKVKKQLRGEAEIKVAEGKARAIQLINEAAEKYFKGNAKELKKWEAIEISLKDNSKIILTKEGINPTILLGELPIKEISDK